MAEDKPVPFNPNLPGGYAQPEPPAPKKNSGADMGDTLVKAAMAIGITYAAIQLVDAVSAGVKKGSEGVGDVLDAAGKVAQDVASLVDDIARMIKYAITWPELVRDAIFYPEKEIAAFHTRWHEIIQKSVEGGALGGAALYVGYDPFLAVWPDPPDNPAFFFDGRMKCTDWHPPCTGVTNPPNLHTDTFVCTNQIATGDVLGVIALHKTRNVMAIDGHMYAWPPELGAIFASLRSGQSAEKGFNVWPDGSAQHSLEGMVEAEMLTGPLYAVEGDSVPLGPTAYTPRFTRWQMEYGVPAKYPMDLQVWEGRTKTTRPLPWGELTIIQGTDLEKDLQKDWYVKVITSSARPFVSGTPPSRWPMALIWSYRLKNWVFGDTLGVETLRTTARMYHIGDSKLLNWDGSLDRGLPVGPAFRVMVSAGVDQQFGIDSLVPKRGFIVSPGRPRRRTFVEGGPEWYENILKVLGTDKQRAAIIDPANDPTDLAPLDGTMRVLRSDGKLVERKYNVWLR